MGLAVDVDKGDGTPHAGRAGAAQRRHDRLRRFLAAYEELIRKVKTQQADRRRLPGRHHHAHQPGHDRHRAVVPRLMPGQGVIVGVGTIDYPAEFQGADERTLADSACQQGRDDHVSTYDHRIIQGAESGMFLQADARAAARRARLLRRRVPAASACRTRRSSGTSDSSPIDSEEAMLHKQMQVATLIRVHRVRGHLIADLDPLRVEGAARCPTSSIRPPTA